MPAIDPSAPSAAIEDYKFQRVELESFALVDRFYRSHGYKVKCASNERVYSLIDPTGCYIAAGRLVPQSSGHYWLRNLLVASDQRGQGLATGLMRQLLPDLSPKSCYCFALSHLTHFYTALGFTQNPAHCPDDILCTYNTYRSRGRDWVLMGYSQA